MSQSTLLLRMELQSNPAMLGVVRGALTRLTEKLGFPEPECRAIVRAVDEALTNIMRHAYKGRPDRPIAASFRSIRLRKDGEKRPALEIILEDQGTTISSAKLHGRALDDIRPGGLGLHFIRQSVDSVQFRRSDGKNRLRLLKFLNKARPATFGEENP